MKCPECGDDCRRDNPDPRIDSNGGFTPKEPAPAHDGWGNPVEDPQYSGPGEGE